MKQFIKFLWIFVFLATRAFAQLTGTKNVPGDYETLGDAIADLNARGVGSGGVTINVIADHTVVAPPDGYAITTRSVTETNPIDIEGNGNRIIGQNQKVLRVPVKSIVKITGGGNITLSGFVTKEVGTSDVPMIVETDAPIRAQSVRK